MNIQTVRALLEDSGVRKSHYVLYPDMYTAGISHEALQVLPDGNYKVYAFDQGKRFNERIFESEHDACMWFLRDGGFTKLYPKIAEAVQ